MNPPPEITDPLLKSLIDEAADLPRMAAREARKTREKNPRRSFHPLGGLAWLMRFHTAQAAVALIILAAMIKGGSLYTGERSPLYNPIVAKVAFWTDDATGTVDINTASDNTFRYSTDASTGSSGNAGTLGANFTINSLNFTGAANTANTRGTLTLVDGTVNTVNVDKQSPTLAGITFSGISNKYEIGRPGMSGALSDGETATFGDVAGEASKFDYSLGTGNIGNIRYSGGNTTSSATTFPFTNIFGGGQITSGLRGGGNAQTSGDNITFNGGTLQYRAANQINQPIFDTRKITSGTTAGRVNGFVNYGSPIAANPAPVLNSGTFGFTSGTNATAGNFGLTKTGSGFTAVAGNGTLNLNGNNVTPGALVGSGTIGSNSLTNQGQVVPIVDAKKLENISYFAQVQTAHTSEMAPAPAATPAPTDARKLIRNAALDFEVTSFESSLDTVGKVAGEEQGYILTQNSDKGANGKLQGTIIVKVLPGNLDRFLLKLRALGDMKNQTVSGQDVTKDYYDTEARIRNSQVTEARLIEMMKTRTGKVSDLLEVENEIAKVRGEIEQMQGQLKYYDGLVQYATVTITLQEKDINQAAAYLLTEHAQLSLFAKDVEKAFAEAKTDAADAKAQTLDSHIERNENGQEVATLHLLLPPENSDEAILKLKAIGHIQNFNSQTQRVARDGSAPSDTAKVDRDKVDISILIQRDAENAVQGTNISVQTEQVEDKTAQIKEAAAAAGVEVKGAEFNRMRNGAEISAMLLRMPMKKYAAFIEQIKSLGKVKDFTVARREDATATEDAPAEIVLQIFSQGNIVAPDTGFGATARHTLGEGMSGLMWSLRMIGVSLGLSLPWVVIGGLGWFILRRRRKARKQG